MSSPLSGSTLALVALFAAAVPVQAGWNGPDLTRKVTLTYFPRNHFRKVPSENLELRRMGGSWEVNCRIPGRKFHKITLSKSYQDSWIRKSVASKTLKAVQCRKKGAPGYRVSQGTAKMDLCPKGDDDPLSSLFFGLKEICTSRAVANEAPPKGVLIK